MLWVALVTLGLCSAALEPLRGATQGTRFAACVRTGGLRGLWTPTTPAAAAAGEAGRVRALQAKVSAQAAELCKLRAAVCAAEEALAAAHQQAHEPWPLPHPASPPHLKKHSS